MFEFARRENNTTTMHEYLLILRIVHIFCAIFWAGGAIILHFFILPAAKNAGPEGGKITMAIANTNKFPMVITLNAILAIIAGCLLFWEKSGGMASGFMGSAMGISLSLGGALGIIAFFVGLTVNKPAATKLEKIGAEVAKAGGPPNAEQAAMIADCQKKLVMGSTVISYMLMVTIICMAAARYI